MSGGHHAARDRGAVDVSISMMFASVATIVGLLVVVEAAAYWHTRNLYDEAASEGVRIAAAYGGDCDQGIDAATAMVQRHGGEWADGVEVECSDGDVVEVTVRGRSAGFLAGSSGYEVAVSAAAPKEG